MPFPSVNSRVYNKNTLSEVICQLRFPPILAIESEVPADFQEAIRQEFPLLNEKVEVQLKVQDEQGLPLPEIVNVQSALVRRKNYEFLTIDERWKINLTSNFFAISTTEYQRWEGLKGHLQKAFDAFREIYSPSVFLRLGLRYKNIIKRSALGLSNTTWPELLHPQMLGMLTTPEIADEIININHVTEIKLDGHSHVRIADGFLREVGTEEIVYSIDSDFFTIDKTEISEALSRLDTLNDQAIRVFDWSISPRLSQAMEPQPS